eukprot:TRINITY_DN51387_c0_g1_i1.p1 TRINITY_DN51387_c0_g1~~TRINITY_DN51387_c0_g1_i1.p1  ORF type:complete len:401 (+),score=129.45 TRINITY_DN51387_c0_g1_i1:76-1203(+)
MAGAARVVAHDAFFYSASRKLLLQARSWRPQDEPEIAAVVLSHHVGDHCNRLHRLGATLAANRIALYASDQQGWGKSEAFYSFEEKRALGGYSGYYAVKSAEQTVADHDKLLTRVMQFYTVKGCDPRFKLERMLKEKRNPWDPEPPIAPCIPVFSMGHGMGAAVATRYTGERAMQDPDKKRGLGGLILVAPWVGSTPDLWRFDNLGVVSNFIVEQWPLLRMVTLEVDPTELVSDLEEVLAWERDQMITKLPLPVCTTQILKKLSTQAMAALQDVQCPLLVMQGGDDPLSPVSAAERVVESCPTSDKDLHLIPDARHDIFRDSELTGQNAMRALVRWVQERAAGYEAPPSPLALMDDEKRVEIEMAYATDEADVVN